MKTKLLDIAIIEHDGKILMRRKQPNMPYKETWYLFGGEVTDGATPEQATQEIVKKQAGIDIKAKQKLWWDSEIKIDHDGEEKFFIYLDSLYSYAGGELEKGKGVEELAWIPIDELGNYDIVPPSRIVYERLGYIK